MYGFQTDFVQNGSIFMVLEHAEGLRNEHLASIEVNMIQSVDIPHLLPLVIRELDFHVSLHYNIAGKRMLSQALQGERFTQQEYYHLLLQIAAALDDCAIYMLQANNYWLHEDYIFVEGSPRKGRLFFTYAPLRDPLSREQPVREKIRSLAMKLLAYVIEPDGSGLQRILQYCGDPAFTVAGCKSLLLQLLSHVEAGTSESAQEIREFGNAQRTAQRGGGRTELAYDSRRRDMSFEDAPQTEAGDPIAGDSRSDPYEPGRYVMSGAGFAGGSDHPAFAADEMKDDEDDLRERQPRKLYVPLSCVAAAAILWRFVYDEAPGPGMAYVCLGLTALLGAFVFIWWKGYFHFRPKRPAAVLPLYDSMDPDTGGAVRRAEASGRSEAVFSFRSFQAEKVSAKLRTNEKENLPDPAGAGVPVAPPNGEAADERYYEQLAHKTEGLFSPQSDATSLLPRSAGMRGAEEKAAVQARPYLERHPGDGSAGERIDLERFPFIIGRSGGAVHYVETAAGVSRTHVELTYQDNGYGLKDLGSKNGTWLGTERIVPYKSYPLSDGDVFAVAGTEYTFRLR